MILHLFSPSIYTKNFISVDHPGDHKYYVSKKPDNYNDGRSIDTIDNLFQFIRDTYVAKALIIHQLNQPRILLLALVLNPKILDRLVWVVWGGDLTYMLSESTSVKEKLVKFMYRRIINNAKYIVTHIHGDYELVQRNLKTKGSYLQAKYFIKDFASETNNFSDEPFKQGSKPVRIFVGNSGDESNNHLEIFDMLHRFSEEDIEVYVPLSYGDNGNYICEIIAAGRASFGEKFFPMTQFIPYAEYKKILSSVNICVFNHQRQQGMGNLHLFFDLGAKVYVRSSVSTLRYYRSIGIQLFETEMIEGCSFKELILFDDSQKERNRNAIRAELDSNNVLAQWQNLFSNL